MNITTWVDNVARQDEFLARHPEISITRPVWSAGPRFSPEYVATGGVLVDPVRDGELGGLLDKLEFIFGETGKPC